MSDLLEIFSRDPLSYTKDAGELRIIIEEYRKRRAQFNLGSTKAGIVKAVSPEKQAVLSIADKMDLDL